ncbi:ribose 5-phosphate isomerase B [Candidatus Giovannonibacteria bacterium RIFCSPLOWO2_01_FULL_46_13]|uniref:Ribose 5-phosphate isomerase B n=1 Tax=Candidatus Giovannonibacteria bacterium RIFCSPLOWO2_01_FULL_46_13 TaxID=1798352 RepID=A0A1F5X4A3_9BACT|nr:MAG: ribose 5-phosphate isomerase B [Candidatus Giovannonibacteria bacterium RIFCSPLOWO2_01_FULL_46_13]
MKIYIGADHAGFELKEKLKKFLEEKGHEVIDKGAYELNPADDYPDFIKPVAEAVAGDKDSMGVVLGGSGQGEAMAANRVKGIRAAVYYGGDLEIVKLSREHNDSNILSLGARFISEEEAKEAVNLWLLTPFAEGRHRKRIDDIDEK